MKGHLQTLMYDLNLMPYEIMIPEIARKKKRMSIVKGYESNFQ